MLVIIGRKEFASFDNAELGWTCIEPTLLQIRGRNSTIKSQVYSQLTRGQQALLMFRVLYDHARNSETEFYCWISSLLSQSSTWSEIIVGLKYFGDEKMLQFLDEVEYFLKDNTEGKCNNALPQDLENDSQLSTVVERFYLLFGQIAFETLNLVGTYIRNNPEEYVRLED
jgi:hypothetical protein